MSTDSTKRKMAAILSADVKGYSRLMSADEDGTVKSLNNCREIIATCVHDHKGRIVDSPGDNVLAEFASTVEAVKCAVKIQENLKTRNADLPESRRMEFRIGVNLGDVIEEKERIYGDGVNIAARLEGLAEPGGICVSGTAFDHVKNKLSVGYQYLGKQTVKNIPDPVRAYKVLMEPEAAGKVIGEQEPKQIRWGWKAFAAVAVLVLVVGGLVWNFYGRTPKIEPASKEKMAFPLPDKPSIAVLPFVNMSGSQDQEFFCDGVTDQIITSLSKIPQLFVIASNSTFVYKGKPVKVQQVAEDLGVRYVLEGSIQKAGERIRIRAQLIDAIDGRHMWAESYDRGVEDVFAIQDEIAGNIITSLQVQLTGGEYARAMGKGTKKLEALEMFWQAHHHLLRFTKEDNLLCRRYSEKAIEIDPKYPSAWAELGFSHNHDSLYGWSSSREQSMKLAEECAQKALSLNSSEPKALILLSQISVNKKEFDKALEYAERAVEANPNDQWAFFFLGTALRILGRHEEAIVNARKAIRLTPYYPAAPLLVLGYCSFLLRKYDDALSAGEELLARSRKGQAPNWWGYVLMIAIHSELGEEEKARQYGAEILNADPNWNLDIWKRTMPSKNQSDMARILDAARKAGLPEKPPFPLPDKPSIAVLPFVNMSEDKGQEYFCDGITEEIIGALSKVGNLFVVSRNSSFTYKGKSVDVRQVGREMGVRYVLEGSVRKEANRLRITAQLIDTTTGDHVFSERYDREMKDVFAVQDDITMKITTAMRVNLTHGEQDRLLAKGTKNLEGYLKILESRKYRETFTRESMAKSRQAAEEAIALDPGYAIAYSAAAGAIGNETWLGVYDDPTVPLSRALELAQKGVALDDSLAFPRIALSFIYLVRKDYDKAIVEAERAVALEPSSTDALTQLGVNLFCGGRAEKAIPILQKAVSLSPVPEYRLVQNLANAYRSAGNYEKAVEINQKILQKQPNQIFPHLQLAATFMLIGKEEEAKHHAGEVMRIDPKFSLERYSKTLPWKNRDEVDRVIDAARKAGVK